MMMVIVEGPDGSGKSRLARALRRERRHALVKHWGPVEHPLAQYRDFITSTAEKDTVICDRFWPSEYAYGRVLRGEDRLGRPGARELERLATDHHRVVLVTCLPPLEVVEENIASRAEGSDMDGVAGRIKEIYDAYATYPTALPRLWHDYTDPDDAVTWKEIERAASRRLATCI